MACGNRGAIIGQGEEFRCACCGRIFEKARSDEDALAESSALFGELPVSELAIVCDDCFDRMGLSEELERSKEGE